MQPTRGMTTTIERKKLENGSELEWHAYQTCELERTRDVLFTFPANLVVPPLPIMQTLRYFYPGFRKQSCNIFFPLAVEWAQYQLCI